MLHTILRIPAAKTQSGYSRSTIYLRIVDQAGQPGAARRRLARP